MDQILPIIDALLPNSALLDEATARGLAIERADKLDTVQFLNLATFLISNNFPGGVDGGKIYKWIKDHGTSSVFNVLSSMEDPTAKALLENLFRLAVEAEDLPTVKYLLKSGVNTNGPACRNKRIPDTLRPLQFACIAGNSELAQELIKAGATIDQPGCGWKSSALVLAIIGEHFCDDANKVTYIESMENDDSDDENGPQYDDEDLVGLINSMIEAGASINLEDLDPFRDGVSFQDENGWSKVIDLDNGPISLQDGHSPLTAASKYRHRGIVDILIRKGANVDFKTNRGTTALHECLYSWEEMNLDLHPNYEPRLPSFDDRTKLFRGSYDPSSMVDVVRSLLAAGACATYSTLYEFTRHESEDEDGEEYCYEDRVFHSSTFSLLDLAVYAQRTKVIEMLLQYGASVTEHSLEVAIEVGDLKMFDYLLKTEVPVSEKICQIVSQVGEYGKGDREWVEMLLIRRQDIHIKRAATIGAIQSGNTSTIDDLLNSETFGSDSLLEGSPKLATAIEQCCTKGYWEVIRRLLDTRFKYRSTIIPWLGSSIHAIISRNNFKMEIHLLGAGANKEADAHNYQTALLVAIQGHDKTESEWMLRVGAALDAECLEMLSLFVDAGADVNATTYNYETALLVAIRGGNHTIIGKILKAGAALNAEGNCCSRHLRHHRHQEFSGAVLVSAIRYGLYANGTVFEDLIEAGADINAPGSISLVKPQHCLCMTPLAAAAKWGDWKCIKILIKNGAAVNNPPGIELSCTPLAAAASRLHSIELVQFLLGEGADLEDAQALEAATEDVELLDFLLLRLKCRPELQNNSNLGRLAVDKAIRCQDKAVVKAILDSKLVDINFIQNCSSVLCQALEHDQSPDLEIIRMILRYGANPNGIVFKYDYDDGDDGYSVQSALLVAVHDENQPKLKLLLEAGAAPDIIVDGMKFYPLQLAVHKQYLAMVQILLDHGADPGATSPYGESGTPLQQATKVQSLEIVKRLLDSKANPNAFSLEANIGTPIQLAAENKDMKMIKVLLDRRANPNIFSTVAKTGAPIQLAAENKDLEMVRFLLECKADPNAVAGNMPHTALQIAARDGRKELVDILLEYGANTNSPPARDSGATALQFAAIGGSLGIAYLLLENGADVNAASAAVKGRTALEGAAEHGRIDMVQLLLNAGANIHDAGQVQYDRALSLASKNEHHATRQILELYHG